MMFWYLLAFVVGFLVCYFGHAPIEKRVKEQKQLIDIQNKELAKYTGTRAEYYPALRLRVLNLYDPDLQQDDYYVNDSGLTAHEMLVKYRVKCEGNSIGLSRKDYFLLMGWIRKPTEDEWQVLTTH